MNLSAYYPLIFATLVALITAEFIFYRRGYRFDDSISNLMTGVSYLSFEAYFRIFALFAYGAWLEHFSFQKLNVSLPVFVGTLLAYDLIIYWNHRLAHRSSLFWAAHIGHHQSEQLNTGAAVRVTIGNRVFYFAPVLLLASAGVPLEVFLIVNTLVGIYPILTHTPLTGRLRGIERIFVTPSHHRVHHGKNPEYIDRNFASLFSFWDYLFGSYEPENAKVNYGITTQMPHYSIYGSQFLQFRVVFQAASEAKGIKNKLTQIFGPPERLKISKSALDQLFGRANHKTIAHAHPRFKIAIAAALSFVFTLLWTYDVNHLNHTAVFMAFLCAWISTKWIQENQTS